MPLGVKQFRRNGRPQTFAGAMLTHSWSGLR